jgi:hypothetical protein
MTYAPTQILGPIVPISNSSAGALPGITQSGAGGAGGITASGIAKELYTRTPQRANTSGNTADYTGQIFLNNDFLTNMTNIISGFIPDYYIDVNRNTKLTFRGVTGSVYVNDGGPRETVRWEILTISYNKTSFLTDMLGGTTFGITGLNIVHDIINGGVTLTAEHIFYRQVGSIET